MTSGPPSHEPVEDTVFAVLKAAAVAAVVLLALPLVVPVIGSRLLGPAVATRSRFWITRLWLFPAAVCGIAVIVALVVVEAGLAVAWLARATAAGGGSSSRVAVRLLEIGWPFLIVNLVAGVLLLPAAFLLRRWRIAQMAHSRTIPDVVLQERIASARTRAAAWSASRRMGVDVDLRTGRIRSTDGAMTAPFPASGRWAFGLVARPTVRSLQERFADSRRVRDWIDPHSEAVILPAAASAARALVVAESGTGKTVLLNGLVTCALAAGWPVFVIDGKGDPADADAMVAQVRASGHSAAVGARWNLFSGTAEQITEKLMRVLPVADGANQHYLDEARGVLGMIQAHAPIRSLPDLWARLTNPAPHLRDAADLHAVEAVVEPRSGLTAAGRTMQALMPALRPLEEWLDAAGWSYARPNADVTVMSLSPVDVTQARLGHLLMVDLRHFLATRLRAGDRSPVLVVVDEFPQLVTIESDPGDAAAALLETARSASAGLILAAQSTAGLSNDDVRRARALASGAALIIGRSKDPDLIVHYAGTVIRLETTGSTQGAGLVGGRAQHTYAIPPQDVREAWDGSFWLIQGGSVAPFRTMPPRRTVGSHAASILLPEHERPTADAPPPPATPTAKAPVAQIDLATLRPMTRKTAAPRFATRFTPGIPTAPSRPPSRLAEGRDRVTALEIAVSPATRGWEAVAYPATEQLVLDDLEPDRVLLPDPSVDRPSSWAEDWAPGSPAPWRDGHHTVPETWIPELDKLLERSRTRHGI